MAPRSRRPQPQAPRPSREHEPRLPLDELPADDPEIAPAAAAGAGCRFGRSAARLDEARRPTRAASIAAHDLPVDLDLRGADRPVEIAHGDETAPELLHEPAAYQEATPRPAGLITRPRCPMRCLRLNARAPPSGRWSWRSSSASRSASPADSSPGLASNHAAAAGAPAAGREFTEGAVHRRLPPRLRRSQKYESQKSEVGSTEGAKLLPRNLKSAI